MVSLIPDGVREELRNRISGLLVAREPRGLRTSENLEGYFSLSLSGEEERRFSRVAREES